MVSNKGTKERVSWSCNDLPKGAVVVSNKGAKERVSWPFNDSTKRAIVVSDKGIVPLAREGVRTSSLSTS